MSGKEKILSDLFEQARNEKLETNLQDIQNWIGMQTLETTLINRLSKLKNLFTKSVIMFTTIILTIGIALGTYLFNDSKNNEIPTQSKIEQPEAILLENSNIADAQFSPEPKMIQTSNVLLIEEVSVQNQDVPSTIVHLSEVDSPNNGLVETIELADSIVPSAITTTNLVENNSLGNEKYYGTFDAIKITHAITAVILQGEKESVRIEGEPSDKRQIVVQNISGTLEVTMEEINTGNKKNKNKSNYSYNKGSLKQIVYITVRDLKLLNCSGAVEVSGNSPIALQDLEVRVSGASKVSLNLQLNQLKLNTSGASEIHFNLQADQLFMTTSGASDIELIGKANGFEINSSGASKLNAFDFEVATAKISASGASDAKVNVAQQIELSVSGASELYYKGNATIVNQHSSGASKIEKVD
jgi:hypothetical protein